MVLDVLDLYPDLGKDLKKKLGLRRGQLDLLAGCPPCQGFSSIRTHNGEIANDPRNELSQMFLPFYCETLLE